MTSEIHLQPSFTFYLWWIYFGFNSQKLKVKIIMMNKMCKRHKLLLVTELIFCYNAKAKGKIIWVFVKATMVNFQIGLQKGTLCALYDGNITYIIAKYNYLVCYLFWTSFLRWIEIKSKGHPVRDAMFIVPSDQQECVIGVWEGTIAVIRVDFSSELVSVDIVQPAFHWAQMSLGKSNPFQTSLVHRCLLGPLSEWVLQLCDSLPQW